MDKPRISQGWPGSEADLCINQARPKSSTASCRYSLREESWLRLDKYMSTICRDCHAVSKACF